MNKNLKFALSFVLLFVIVYLRFYNPKSSEIILKSVQLQALLGFAIFYIVINFSSNFIKYLYSKKNKIPKGDKNNVHFGIENIANFFIGIAVIILVFSFSGIKISELIYSFTIVAAAIAILTKEYILDFISGIYLSFSNAFEINDYVKLGELRGKIVDISMLKVKLLNDDDDVVIIPNSKVHFNEIINYTKGDLRLMTVDFQIALKYISNIEQLENELISSLKGFEEYIETDSYNLKVVEMKMDYLELKFQYTLKKIDMNMQRKIRRKTIREVFNFISSKRAKIKLDETS